MKYEILGKRFCKWYKEEYERVWDEWYGESVPDSLLKELNITKDAYYKTYIYPYLRLKKEHLKITLDILAFRLKKKIWYNYRYPQQNDKLGSKKFI